MFLESPDGNRIASDEQKKPQLKLGECVPCPYGASHCSSRNKSKSYSIHSDQCKIYWLPLRHQWHAHYTCHFVFKCLGRDVHKCSRSLSDQSRLHQAYLTGTWLGGHKCLKLIPRGSGVSCVNFLCMASFYYRSFTCTKPHKYVFFIINGVCLVAVLKASLEYTAYTSLVMFSAFHIVI